MKKIIPVILLFTLVLASCKKERESLKNPSEVGTKVFNILRDMDRISAKEFENRIGSFEEMKALADDTEAPLGDYIRNDFKTVTPESHERIALADYNSIKKQGLKYNIKWDKIAFLNLKHEIQTMEQGKMLLLETYFRNIDNQIYFVKTAAVFDGQGYITVKIAEIEPKHKEGAF